MPDFIDLKEQQFGQWTVIKEVKVGKPGAHWLCECSCANKTQRIFAGRALRHHNPLPCEQCLQLSRSIKEGDEFGSLRVISRAKDTPSGSSRWLCECLNDGNIVERSGQALLKGQAPSCGCLNPNKSNAKGPIFELRQKMGWSRDECAKQLGISKDAVRLWEREGRAGTRHTAKKIRLSLRLHGIDESDAPHHLEQLSCARCHRGIVRSKVDIQKNSYQNKSGLLFCSSAHAQQYRWHGPLPKPDTSEISPVIVAQFDRPAKPREKRESKKWVGMEKTLKKAKV